MTVWEKKAANVSVEFSQHAQGIHLFTFKNHQSRGSISDKQSKTKLYGWSECNETETKLVKINQQISLTTWRRRCGPGSVSAAAPQCCTAPPQRHWSRQSLPWAGGRRWSGSPGHGTHICSGIELRPQTGVEQPWTHDSERQWEWLDISANSWPLPEQNSAYQGTSLMSEGYTHFSLSLRAGSATFWSRL